MEFPVTIEDQAKFDELVRDRLTREQAKFSDYADLKQFKVDAEATLTAATQKIADLEAEKQQLTGSLSAKDAEVERVKVASEKKVPAKWITGSTRAEMEAAADEWLTDAKAVSKPGVVPGHGTGDPNAQSSPYEAGRERAAARYKQS